MSTTASVPPVRTDLAWDATLDRLRAFIARRVGDPETAADIAQDVIVRSIAAGALERVDDPIAWLHRSARNAIIDHYRTRRTHLPLDDRTGEPLIDEPWNDEPWNDEAFGVDAGPNKATRELSHCLAPLLDQLPDSTREALVRVELDGHTQRRAARDAGVSVSGMKSRVQRGRRALRDLLERCCAVEVDRRGAITAYRPSDERCGCISDPHSGGIRSSCQSPSVTGSVPSSIAASNRR